MKNNKDKEISLGNLMIEFHVLKRKKQIFDIMKKIEKKKQEDK